MDRKNRILHHPLFVSCYEKTKEREKERIFCRHDIGHFLDVARIALLLALREQAQVEPELLYAAALLHDIGRFRQYEDGTPHEEESARLAAGILRDCGFSEAETAAAAEAIAQHRTEHLPGRSTLSALLYRADKLSRRCFFCAAQEACHRKEEKKNRTLTY